LQRFQGDLHIASEGKIDIDDDEKRHEDHGRKHSGHDDLCRDVLCAKEKSEGDVQNCSAEQDRPHDVRNSATAEFEPLSSRFGQRA
jgi:hypothetical protein